MRDAFEGAWRVRETVFAPDGTRLGEVAQLRRVVHGADGSARVVQDCTPGSELASHPMARFAGHHEFELRREGALRRYDGPAVVGSAVSLGDGAMLGRGVWPAFGWAFTSWSVMVSERRQLTGGRFFRGGHAMASIVGVAAPHDGVGEGPSLGEAGSPASISTAWAGVRVRVDASGCRCIEEPAMRRYEGAERWTDVAAREELAIALTRRDEAVRVEGGVGSRALHGVGQRHGPALALDAAMSDGGFLESQEILDVAGGHLVVLRRWLVDNVPQWLEALRLRPEERS